MTASPAAVRIDRFSFWYGTAQALRDVSLPVAPNRITAFIGPSGCGKSTLLRSINRMNELLSGTRHEGDIQLLGESVYAPTVDVVQLRRRIGMVFQHPNPFPTMSIFDNVAAGLRVNGRQPRRAVAESVERALRGAALWDEVKHRLGASPLGLSGGQQQRLCIARAIAPAPEVVLLDEPTSALDPIATQSIEELVQEIKRDFTVVMVTHNMQQASRTSDYTSFMYLGRIVEYGPTIDVFQNPHLPETEDYITGRFG